MKKNTFLTVLFFWVGFVAAQPVKIFYVAQTGNDKYNGSLARPFASILKAKQATQEWIAKNNKGVIEIIIRGGNYFIAEPLIFTRADGGNDDLKIVYKAYNKEKVIFSGGKKIVGWQRYKDNIYQVAANGLNFRQLYINNKRGTRARQPNVGSFNRLQGWDIENKQILIKSTEVANLKNFEGVEAVIQMYWAESYVHLKSYSTIGNSSVTGVSIKDEQAAILFPRPFPQKQQDACYHFENAFEFIDQPGEWYLDRKAGILYYMKSPGQDIEELEFTVPVTESLIKIRGTLDHPVKNIVFEDLRFECSNWSFPNQNGFINAQAGMYNLSADKNNIQVVSRPAAAIEITNSENILFESNILQNMGSTAIDLISGTKNCRINGNLIKNISGNGIMIGAFSAKVSGAYGEVYNPADKRELSIDNQVTNNFITYTGQDYYGTCGITAGYPTGLKIENNVVTNVPYSGISVGFGWTDAENAMKNNNIAHNEIIRPMQVLCDGAGIYTLSFQPGTRIFGNYIHDIKRSRWAGPWPIAAIYLDEGSGGTMEDPFVVENNVFIANDVDVRQYHMNTEGIILYKKNFTYIIDSAIAKAGLIPYYKKLIKEKIEE